MPRLAPDQAEGLRRLFVENVRRMIALVSCGEQPQGYYLMADLANLLAARGKQVLVLDEQLSARERHDVFGITPEYDLDDVLTESIEIERVAVMTPTQVALIAGGGRADELTRPRMETRIGLINDFYRFAGRYDVVLVNTGSASIQRRPSFAWASQDVIVLCHNRPETMTQAYALIKELHHAGERRFHLLFGHADETIALDMFRRIANVSRRHLHFMPANLGVLTDTGRLPEAIAEHVLSWPLPEQLQGHFPALMRRLLRAGPTRISVSH